jgi:TetR/AcrR family transcriptional regulator, cholesterol catabolism regulator
MARNGTQKSIDRAREIYLTAAQIFFTKGFDSTSLNDIAEALGITKAGLYYYVESKQDLLFQIMNLGLDSVRSEVLLPAREITDAEARLKFTILNHARLSAGGNHAVVILSDEIGSLNFTQREKILKRRRLYFEFVRDTLVELEREGKLYKIDITTATFTLFGMILWLARWFHSNGKLSIDKVCEDVCRMALQGLLREPQTI